MEAYVLQSKRIFDKLKLVVRVIFYYFFHCVPGLSCLYPRFRLFYSVDEEEPNGQKPETIEETNRARAREGRGTEV